MATLLPAPLMRCAERRAGRRGTCTTPFRAAVVVWVLTLPLTLLRLLAGGRAKLFADTPTLQQSRLGSAEEVVKEQQASERRLHSKFPYNWVLVKESAAFSARYAHTATINSKQHIFVIGGTTAELASTAGYLNDVWVSTDQGHSWDVVVARSPRFSPRRGHAFTLDSHKQVMFLLGGFCGGSCFRRDWWNSEDGSVWVSMGDAPWSARHGHAAVVTSSDRLVLLGGHDGLRYLADVWAVQDPAQATLQSSWERLLEDAPWSPRYGHAVVIDSKDRIFLMGGFFAAKQSGHVACFNDVWQSDDGGSGWSLVVQHAPWSGRYQHSAVLNTKDEIFIIGGLDLDLERCGDVWRSEDGGRTWLVITPSAPWAARYEHAVVSDQNNSLYILGGMSSEDEKFNDVWRSERTCADDVQCPGDTETCRDGVDANFQGLPNPICVGICDRRIFDNCTKRQACRVVEQKAVCVHPCDEKRCGSGEVCEVAKRGETYKGKELEDAEAYCLACDSAKSLFTCDKLKQCEWRKEAEVCNMRCKVMKSKEVCGRDDHCEWSRSKGACKEKKKEKD